MNRLWVRISLIIAVVVLFVALLPSAIRLVTRPDGGSYGPPPPPDFSESTDSEIAERIAQAQTQAERRIWQNTLITLGIGSLIGIGMGIWLSRGISKPLTEIEKGARALAGHDLAYRVPEAGTAEMQTVAHAFNEMAEELETSERLRRNLLADVTHELRHPVHVLRGNLQGILDGVFPLEMAEIAQLSEQTRALSQLVNDLHELSLAEARELPLHPQPTDLNVLVGRAADAVMPLAQLKGIDLVVQHPTHPTVHPVDADRMRQVIQNLLGNAIRYTPENGRVTLTVTPDTITIQDTGIGITAEEMPHIFNRFYRSDASRSRESNGAGLGLAIAKAIVEAHDGTLTAKSDGRGMGTVFEVRLKVDS